MRLLTADEAKDVIRRINTKPTVFIECTETLSSGINTGIQRVVRNILRHAERAGERYGFNIVPVTLAGDRLVFIDPTPTKRSDPPNTIPYRAARRIKRIFFNTTMAHSRPAGLDDIDVSNHVLLLLDACWHLPIKGQIHSFRQRRGQVITVFYDLIPITHPAMCDDGLVQCFKDWVEFILSHCADFVAISKSSASQLSEYAKSLNRFVIPADHFYLGADLDLVTVSGEVSPETVKAFSDNSIPHFVMVGSIEPRKNHSFALDAFERYWAQGGNGAFVIIGKQGWKNEDILNRIRTHSEFGSRLHLLRNASDTDLTHAYKHAAALLLPSVAEGFGLPIVEAESKGLPVICSDLPVFREISNKATFFDISAPKHLAKVLINFKEPRRDTTIWFDWKQSAEQLFAVIKSRTRYHNKDLSQWLVS